MSQRSVQELLATVRQSIERIESTLGAAQDERLIRRVLAYLWTAHDELELMSTSRP